MEERTELETVHLVDSHYRRNFGRSPDKEMREQIRKDDRSKLIHRSGSAN